MNDDWTEIDAFTDATGKRLSVGWAVGLVRIAVKSPASLVLSEIVLDSEHREQFAQAFMKAEWGADGAEHVGVDGG